MDRAKFLALTGLTESGFTTLAHKKVLPFSPMREAPKGWAAYQLRDVLLTDVMLAHMDQGLGRQEACLVVRGAGSELWSMLEGGGVALSNALLGFARFQSVPADSDEPAATLDHPFTCLLHELPSRLEELKKRARGTLSGFAMVDVCERLAAIQKRAQAAGLMGEIQAELEAMGGPYNAG